MHNNAFVYKSTACSHDTASIPFQTSPYGRGKGRGSKIENATCKRSGAEGSLFAVLLPNGVDFRMGRKVCDKRGRSLHICREVFNEG